MLQRLKSLLQNRDTSIVTDELEKNNELKEDQSKYGFWGDYQSWEEAIANSAGYDDDVIFAAVKNSHLLVRDRKAAYVRDSVIFDRIEYSFPVLAMLFKIALENDQRVSVLDFGGALGSHYFQYRDFLSNLDTVEWSIIEQPRFVDCGRELFEDGILKFYPDIDRCLQEREPHLILLSGAIQCLEKPYETIETVLAQKFPYIIFDRTAFMKDPNREILTVQVVPPTIYPSSYPSWFLSRNRFLSFFEKEYDLLFDFEALDKVSEVDSEYKGFVFQRKIGSIKTDTSP